MMKIWIARIDDSYLNESQNYENILDLLNGTEGKQVTRFVFQPDRQRALLSIILQRAIIHETFQFTNASQYSILRTKEVTVSTKCSTFSSLMLGSF
jgi:phosphopantetheinyl transferase